MAITSNSFISEDDTKSDEDILSGIGINIGNLKSLKRQQRVYYRNIIQCLRQCETVNNQQKTNECYLEIIGYLCQIKKHFSAIQILFNTPISLNQDFPEIVICFSEYLLIKGFGMKIMSVCQQILDSFADENINLLEIEFLYIQGKSVISDRVSSCQLFQEIHEKTETNSILYLQSLICVAYAQFSIGKYKESLFNFEKVSNCIENNQCFKNNYQIYRLKANILEGKARLLMTYNKWKKSLSVYKELENICKECKFIYQLIQCLGHQGIINRKIKNYNLALQYLYEARSIAIKIDSETSIEWINHHIAYVYLNTGKVDLAEQISKECLQKAVSEQRDNEAGDYYEQIGLINLSKGHVNKAIEYLELSLFFRKKTGNKHGTASSYKHLSLAFLLNSNYLKSYQALKKCTHIFHKSKVLNFTRLYHIIYLFIEWIIGKKRYTA